MKSHKKYNDVGATKEESDEVSTEELRIQSQTGITHSIIWGIVVLFIAILIYVTIRYGKCAC